MENELWPPEWQRGFLEMMILSAVAVESEPTYGYRIVQVLEAAGLGRIKGGTLYPILAKLEAAGFIASHWGEGDGGPGRKFVNLTAAGRARLRELATQWRAFRHAIDSLIAGSKGEQA
jgi:PadR family transcriptional regulator PadR